jgi:circadian clock protein KaiC
MSQSVMIRKLSSGVPGLDEVLGGGIPELSFNLIAGGPGCGKTTLAHQILFAAATLERRALYISVLGEPPLKMLRYQQQFGFFDVAKLNETIRFVHLGQEALDGGLDKILARIVEEIEASSPSLVIVDSFRSVVRTTVTTPHGELELQGFMQRLALHLTSCETTSFLVGEYLEHESENNSVFTVADGILWLYQAVDRNSVVRKLQVVKMRGQGQIPGLHTMRISKSGLNVFPRLPNPEERQSEARPPGTRLSCGAPGLDEMMGGGIPAGYTVLLAGPSGSGKTVLANQFLMEGARGGERGILAVFEKRPNDYLQTTPRGREFAELVREGRLEVLYVRPLDLSVDEMLLALREAVLRTGATRAVIDSLSGLELALAPTFREDFRESLYRMLGALAALGVTVMATVELADSYTDLQFSPQGVAFLTDAILLQRYVEIEGQIQRVLAVVKMRASQHSKELRAYEITPEGVITVGAPLLEYDGLLTGRPHRARGEAGRRAET